MVTCRLGQESNLYKNLNFENNVSGTKTLKSHRVETILNRNDLYNLITNSTMEPNDLTNALPYALKSRLIFCGLSKKLTMLSHRESSDCDRFSKKKIRPFSRTLNVSIKSVNHEIMSSRANYSTLSLVTLILGS